MYNHEDGLVQRGFLSVEYWLPFPLPFLFGLKAILLNILSRGKLLNIFLIVNYTLGAIVDTVDRAH